MKTFFSIIITLLAAICHSQSSSFCFDPVINVKTGGIGTSNSVLSVDLNNDGVPDLASAGSAGLSVLMGNNNSTFQEAVSYTAGSFCNYVFSGDFNGDNAIDLGIVNYFSNNISVFLGTGGGNFMAAVNYSLGVNTNPKSAVAKDFNNDGKTDIAVANFGSQNVAILMGNGNGTFNSPVNYAILGQPSSIMSTDFNNDGKNDLIVGNSNQVSILLGNGNGTFVTPVNYPLSISTVESVATGDFNSDGQTDLAVAASTSYSVAILSGNGNGTFGAPVYYNMNSLQKAIISTDVDADGALDLVVACSGYTSVLFGSSNGIFSNPVNYSFLYSQVALTSGDFNGDSRQDLVAVNGNTSGFSMLLNNNGTLLPPIAQAVSVNADAIASADLNADNINDIVTAGYDYISVLLGRGNGKYNAAKNYSTGSIPNAITIADFNGDNIPDLAAANRTSNNVSILLGLGNGYFNAAVNYTVGTQPYSIAAGDFNGDGSIDLATANYGSNNISVLWGNGIGSFSVTLSVYYAPSSAPVSITTADFNADGRKDLAVANYYITNQITNLLGQSNSSFIASSITIPGGTYPVFISSDDYNTDGNIDLSMIHHNSICVLYGSGTGSFGGPTSYSLGTTPAACASGDVNGDNKNDIIITNYGGTDISVLLGNNSGNFNPAFSYTVGNAPYCIIVSDLNNDTRKDIALVNRNLLNISVLLNQFPVLNIVGPGVICSGNSATLTVSGAMSYTWSNGLTTNTISVSPTSTTAYSVIGISSMGCTNSSSTTISVSTNSLPVISVSSGTICGGDNFTLTPVGANTYTYSGGSDVVSPLTTTSYTVTGTGPNGCIGTTTAQVAVNPAPVIAVANGSICEGETFTLSPGGADTYTYSGGSDIVSPLSTTIYTIIGADANNCSNTQTVSVIVNSLPLVSAVSSNSMICIGETATLTVSGASSYTWSSSSNNTIIAVSPTVTTSYTVSGSDVNGCTNTAVVTQHVDLCTGINQAVNNEGIVVYPNPAKEMVTIQSNTEFNRVQVVNVAGQTILSESVNGTTHQLNLSGTSKGIYMLVIYQKDKMVKRERIVVNK